MLQRDEFINVINESIPNDPDIYFLSADFGAEALDKLRNDYKDNFIHCGISEQAMIDVATGLALQGKKVFVYAMAPFLSLRAIEQIKCGPGMMDLPICLISVGVGLGYADSGPTHYTNEEFACLRSISGSTIYSAADSMTARLIAKELVKNPKFSYVRLDRHELESIDSKMNNEIINTGYRVIGEFSDSKTALVSHGKMVQRCVEITNTFPDEYYTIDVIQSKPITENLLDFFRNVKNLVVVDEQVQAGALGSAIFEKLSSNNIYKKIALVNLADKYIFENGGREYLLDNYGLAKDDIINAAKTINSDNN